MKKGASLDDPVVPTVSSWAWSLPEKPTAAMSTTAAPTYFLARRITGIVGSFIDQTPRATQPAPSSPYHRERKREPSYYRSLAVLGDQGGSRYVTAGGGKRKSRDRCNRRPTGRVARAAVLTPGPPFGGVPSSDRAQPPIPLPGLRGSPELLPSRGAGRKIARLVSTPPFWRAARPC